MNTPLFSIVVPVYNAERYLEQCLDSILGQKEKRFEVILVDDGSTDSSFSILNTYAMKYNCLKVFHRENQGPLATRRFALEQAKGIYLVFVDSDDFISEEMLAELATEIDEYDHDMFIYRFNAVKPDGSNPVGSRSHFSDGTVLSGREKEKLFKKVLGGAFHSLCIKAIKRNLMVEDPMDYASLGRMSYSEDLLMSLHPLTQANSIKYLDRIYYWYRKNPGSLVKSFNSNKVTDLSRSFGMLHEKMQSWGLGEEGERLFSDAYVSAAITIFNSALFERVEQGRFKSIVHEFIDNEPSFREYLKTYRNPVGTDKLGKLFPVLATCLLHNRLGLYYCCIRSTETVYSFVKKVLPR